MSLLLAATLVLAQGAKTIKVQFEGEGQRLVWIQAKGEEHKPFDAQSVSGKSVEIETPETTKDRFVFVCDTSTGGVVSKSLDEVLKTGSWTVDAKGADTAYAVAFHLVHDGKPVSAAVVKLKSKSGERTALVTPADEGKATFWLVPFGDVEVVVDYKSGEEDKSLGAQVFEVKSGMEPIELEITGDVETIAPVPVTEPKGDESKKEPEGEKKEEPQRTNPFLTLFNMLIGLVVIGGIAYAIWRYVKANPDQTADALKSAGVAMPGDSGPAPTPKKAGPPSQIILDDAAPTPAGDATVAFASTSAVKNPRLVKGDGSLFLVQDGTQSVGREGGDFELSGESSVSRLHAKLVRTGDSVTLEDAGSTNGTFVNGVRVSGPTVLNHGDSVQFGAVSVRYEE